MRVQKGDKAMDKEKQILNYMQRLDLTREEAEQLYKDEEEDNLPELTADQKKVEKEMRQADRKKETTPRKRERKPDEDKRFLIGMLQEFIENPNGIYSPAKIVNPEREIELKYNGNRYRLVLIKPRKEK